ncbi:hypothetical protein K431DRAFT_101680 [Polychaeton citri CBS 116435]|uniref:Uncharacterized protein n=1 Tax=Polychaeton citri CBS 116435 TaxID=1314669 RepID=A0A9P4UPG1_9PEZI|nr:hypothetical protein K431DRAFT_101680 [Polychaeton citri CBS 116435]
MQSQEIDLERLVERWMHNKANTGGLIQADKSMQPAQGRATRRSALRRYDKASAKNPPTSHLESGAWHRGYSPGTSGRWKSLILTCAWLAWSRYVISEGLLSCARRCHPSAERGRADSPHPLGGRRIRRQRGPMAGICALPARGAGDAHSISLSPLPEVRRPRAIERTRVASEDCAYDLIGEVAAAPALPMPAE